MELHRHSSAATPNSISFAAPRRRSSRPTMPGVEDLAVELSAELDSRLAAEDDALVARFPGERPGRQPVHTVYVPADRYAADLTAPGARRRRQAMRRARRRPARLPRRGDADLSAAGRGQARPRADRGPADRLRGRLRHPPRRRRGRRRRREPRARWPSPRQDGTAAAFVRDPVQELRARRRRRRGLAHPRSGSSTTLLAAGGSLDGFVVTLPKVTWSTRSRRWPWPVSGSRRRTGSRPARCASRSRSRRRSRSSGPTAPPWSRGWCTPRAGRVVGLHYGTYDYSAFCGIAAPYQSLEHPVADHAKAVMQAAAAGTGVRLSDGSTNVLPVGDADAGTPRPGRCTSGWSRRSLERGFYQGWDLHPAQLPTRYAATYAFYRDGLRRCRRPPAALRDPAPRAASPTSRPPRGRWPTSCSAASTAAPSTPTRCRQASGMTSTS